MYDMKSRFFAQEGKNTNTIRENGNIRVGGAYEFDTQL